MKEKEGNLPKGSWLRKLKSGDQVWWNDPDLGISSGIHTIDSISGSFIVNSGTVLVLKSDTGGGAEVFASELAPSQPEGLFPVVDGDAGDGDIYGYADSNETAMAVGNATFADKVDAVYLAENITLRDGTFAPKAWVALTLQFSEKATVRLTVDVTYDLNGETVAVMVQQLEGMVDYAMDNGMLTGSTAAAVKVHSVKTAILQAPLSESDLADFMLRRIENQQIAPEDIPVRLARYGLMDPADFVTEMRERMENEGRLA